MGALNTATVVDKNYFDFLFRHFDILVINTYLHLNDGIIFVKFFFFLPTNGPMAKWIEGSY